MSRATLINASTVLIVPKLERPILKSCPHFPQVCSEEEQTTPLHEQEIATCIVEDANRDPAGHPVEVLAPEPFDPDLMQRFAASRRKHVPHLYPLNSPMERSSPPPPHSFSSSTSSNSSRSMSLASLPCSPIIPADLAAEDSANQASGGEFISSKLMLIYSDHVKESNTNSDADNDSANGDNSSELSFPSIEDTPVATSSDSIMEILEHELHNGTAIENTSSRSSSPFDGISNDTNP